MNNNLRIKTPDIGLKLYQRFHTTTQRYSEKKANFKEIKSKLRDLNSSLKYKNPVDLALFSYIPKSNQKCELEFLAITRLAGIKAIVKAMEAKEIDHGKFTEGALLQLVKISKNNLNQLSPMLRLPRAHHYTKIAIFAFVCFSKLATLGLIDIATIFPFSLPNTPLEELKELKKKLEKEGPKHQLDNLKNNYKSEQAGYALGIKEIENIRADKEGFNKFLEEKNQYFSKNVLIDIFEEKIDHFQQYTKNPPEEPLVKKDLAGLYAAYEIERYTQLISLSKRDDYESAIPSFLDREIRKENEILSLYEKRLKYMRETIPYLEEVQQKLSKVKLALGFIAIGSEITTTIGMLNPGSGTDNPKDRAGVQLNLIGKALKLSHRWVGPLGIIGLLRKIPNICTALRSCHTSGHEYHGRLLLLCQQELGISLDEAIQEFNLDQKTGIGKYLIEKIAGQFAKEWLNPNANQRSEQASSSAAASAPSLSNLSKELLLNTGHYHTIYQHNCRANLSHSQEVFMFMKAVHAGVKSGLLGVTNKSGLLPGFSALAKCVTTTTPWRDMKVNFTKDKAAYKQRAAVLKTKASVRNMPREQHIIETELMSLYSNNTQHSTAS